MFTFTLHPDKRDRFSVAMASDLARAYLRKKDKEFKEMFTDLHRLLEVEKKEALFVPGFQNPFEEKNKGKFIVHGVGSDQGRVPRDNLLSETRALLESVVKKFNNVRTDLSFVRETLANSTQNRLGLERTTYFDETIRFVMDHQELLTPASDFVEALWSYKAFINTIVAIADANKTQDYCVFKPEPPPSRWGSIFY